MKKLVTVAQKFQWLVLALGAVIPFGYFLYRTLSVSTVQRVLTEASFIQALFNSVLLSAAVSVPATVMAFASLWLLQRFAWHFKVRRLTEFFFKAPYFVPPFFLAMGWIALAAPSAGYLNLVFQKIGFAGVPSIYGLRGAGFVLFLWTSSFCAIQLQTFFNQFPGVLEDAAMLCGARPWQSFFKIVLPLARPHLIHCFLTAFVSTLAAFGVPALLAMPARQHVLTTRVFQSIKGSQDFSEAAFLSLVLLLVTGILLFLQKKFFSTHGFGLVSGKACRSALLKPTPSARLGMALLWVFVSFSFVLPIGSIALLSLLRDRSDLGSFSFDKYVYVFASVPDGLKALQNSAFSAFLAAIFIQAIAVVVAYGSVRLKLTESKVLLEFWNFIYAVPGTVLALVLLVFFNGTLTDTLWILAFAYAIKYAAFSIRTIVPALGALSKEFEEAAWISGASEFKAFLKIVLPLLKPALSAAFFLSFLPMVSELTMSVFLAGAGTETAGTLIYRFLDYADPGAAAVLAVFLIALTFMMNGFLRKISKGSFGI